MATPVTNHTLHRLVLESGYSLAAIGRHVNAVLGGASAYDRASVFHWLRGRTPEPAARAALADVLSRRLGRRVDPAELGFGTGDLRIDDALTFPADLATGIDVSTALWRNGADRHRLLGESSYIPAAAPEAAFAWHFAPEDQAPTGRGRARVTAADIERLHAARSLFLDLDRQQGGGTTHPWASDYLTRQVTPLLHGRYDERTGRDLFSAASRLTEQCGYMYYDAGAHGAALRHYVQALRLAKAAGDRRLSGHIMGNMSVQACFLGRGPDAVRLARSAQAAAGSRAPAALLAWLCDTEARGHALLGDRSRGRDALARASRHLDRVTGADEGPPTGYTPAHHAGTCMHVLRDLGHPEEAERHASAALATGAAGTRAQALHRILLASVVLRRGEPEQACHLAALAAGSSQGLASQRLTARIAEFRTTVQPHAAIGAVRDFLAMTAGQADRSGIA